MAGNGKRVQWQNTVQNHQNGQPLPVLDPKVAGAGKAIELETFPKKAPEIKTFLDYKVCKKFNNVLLILHVMSPILYHEFQKPMMLWSMMNKYYMTKTIFKRLKDTIVNIGHLTDQNPF
eukprot:7074965-Ditylum_brightwellii.AAC.1